ncbi:MAG: nitric oxide reductase subunit B, partial [Gammaproteobacteria bacterium]
HYKLKQSSDWVHYYHWPIMFMLAVAFWNLVGAGLLGFLINPPLALYYLQGLMSTATHGHAALFGVYGMLAIGLLLFCLRGLTNPQCWSDGLLKWTFWSLNIGLALMLVLSLLPQGIIQTLVSVYDGYWAARSPDWMHSPLMETLVWMRVPGDMVFAFGVGCLMLFVIKLYRKPVANLQEQVSH